MKKKNRNKRMRIPNNISDTLLLVIAFASLAHFFLRMSLIIAIPIVSLILGSAIFLPFVMIPFILNLFIGDMLYLPLSAISRGWIESAEKCMVEGYTKPKRSTRGRLKNLANFSVNLMRGLIHIKKPILFGLLCIVIACAIFVGEINALIFSTILMYFLLMSWHRR